MPKLRFGVFELDVDPPALRRRGVAVPLPGQSLRLLVHLAQRPGQVVTREELRLLLWPDGTHVEFDGSLNFAVSRLRRVLGDRAESPLFVETLPRVGYRFLAPLSRIEPVPAVSAPARTRRMALTAAALLALLPWAPARRDQVSAAPPAQVEAAYRAGLYGLRDPGRLPAGTRALQRVVAEAPGFGPGWAALAESWQQQAEVGLAPPALAWPRAVRAARGALDLGEADRAGLVLAAASLRHDRDPAASRRWLDGTRRDSARALLLDAELLFLEGDPEAALRSARRAEDLDPVCPVVQGQLGELLYLSRRFPEAAAAWERAAQMAPDLIGPRVRVFHAWRQAGNSGAALQAARDVLRLLGRDDELTEGTTAFLRGTLAHLEEEARRQPAVVADRIAVLHAALGEDEAARAWLERARVERSPGLALTLAADPDLDRLRSRPDFPRS